MKRFAALDTRFILALAAGEHDAEATLDYLNKTGFFPIITESVFEQLGELTGRSNDPACAMAKYACTWLSTWQILAPSNQYVENGTAQIHAERLIAQGLVAKCTALEVEMLVEASCHNCELFVTFSDGLLTAPSAPLNLALLEMELNKVTVTIASPVIIAQRLQIMQAEEASRHST